MYTLEWWGVALIVLVGYLIGYFFGKREASNSDEIDTKTFIELQKYEIDRKYQAEILKHQMDIAGMKKKEKEDHAVQED